MKSRSVESELNWQVRDYVSRQISYRVSVRVGAQVKKRVLDRVGILIEGGIWNQVMDNLWEHLRHVKLS